jgi:hypothetical protein
MTDDPRCCGTGTCIINNEGTCWCGQHWDGEKMCFDRAPTSESMPTPAAADSSTHEPDPH